VWGLALIVLGAFFLIAQLVPGFSGLLGGLIWAAVMVGVGAAFLGVYVSDRARWWALIPAYVFAAIGGIIALATIGFRGDGIAAFVLMAIALPFFYVYLRDRRQWWALIPAYVMTAITMLVLLPFRMMPGEWVAAYINFAVAVPFLYVYLRNRKNWWALIPAGITGLIGAAFLAAGAAYLIPALMVVAGIYLLVRYLGAGRREPAAVAPPAPAALPKTGPQADRPATEFTPLGVSKEEEAEEVPFNQ
jgi:hypothetical protein